MPYKIFKENDEFCVYKHDPTGKKTGEALGCHTSREDAAAQMKALYASEQRPMEAATPARAQILREIIPLTEAVINPDTHTVEVVLIRPGWSANDRYYSPEALANAAALFEGRKAYANHPSADMLRKGEGRSVLDITGDYTGLHVGEGGELRATRNVFGAAGEAIWPLIVRGIESQRPVIGLSINAVGKARHGKGPDGKEGIIVEAITAVHSVDDVTEPAAGGGFERLVASTDTLTADLLAAMTYEEFIAARPDYVETIREQQKRVRQDEAVRAAYEARDQIQEDLVEAQARIAALEQEAETHRAEADHEHRAAALGHLLNEAAKKLPTDWLPLIRQDLEAAEASQWPAILAREQAKAAAVKTPIPVSGAPTLTPAPIPVVEHKSPVLDMSTIHTPEDLRAVLESMR